MLTASFTQDEYNNMLTQSKLMTIQLISNISWIGLIYELDKYCVIFNPLLLKYELGSDNKYNISFDYVSIGTKDQIFIINSNNIIFCATVNPLIKEQYKKYYNINESNETIIEDDIEDNLEEDFDDKKTNIVNISKRLH